MKAIRQAVETVVFIIGVFLALSAIQSIAEGVPVRLPNGWRIFLLALVIVAAARAFVDRKRDATPH